MGRCGKKAAPRALGGKIRVRVNSTHEPLGDWPAFRLTARLRCSHRVFSSRRKRLMVRHSCDHGPRRTIASTSALHVQGGRFPRASCSGDTLYCTPCSHVAVSLQLLMAVETA